MITTTIAVIESLNIKEIDDEGNIIYWVEPTYAPIWIDEQGNEYLVASGIFDKDYLPTEPVEAVPDRVNIVVGIEGLLALKLMKLTVKEVLNDLE